MSSDDTPLTQVLEMAALPPTLNDIIGAARRNRFVSASEKRAWTDAVAFAAKTAGIEPFVGEVWIEFVWFVKNKRRDQDNITAAQKYILDGLVNARIIVDDNLSVIKSPVVHWIELSKVDGFALAIRNEKAQEIRRLDGLSEPFQYQLSGSAAQPATAMPSSRRTTAKKTTRRISTRRK